MKIAMFVIGAVLVAASAPAVAQSGRATVVEVFKTPTCGCCGKWVEHLRAHGFRVRTTDLPSTADVQARHGVPVAVRTCHTARVGGYTVEGHVPADAVRKLLKERPQAAGIAVPGMPAGSPGMEVPGGHVQPYQVLTFDRQGRVAVFASYGR